MHGYTAFQYDLLAAVAREGPAHGLAIKQALEATHDKFDGEVNHGRMYPNLDDLVAAGLVEKGQRDGRTNEYALTDAGRLTLQARVGQLAAVDGV